MRPLKLKMRNFRSFENETIDIDENANLVGIVGEIGSGKTTVLDGICYALFGVTPTASRPEISRLIRVGSSSAQVGLLFETARGERWEAVRTIGNNASHALYKVEDEKITQTISLKSEVDQKIEELIGLDYSSFTRAVMLPQGQFAKMLRGTQTEREDTLRKALGFDQIKRMRDMAKTQRDHHQVEQRRIESVIAAKGDVTQRLETTFSQLKERRKQLKKVRTISGRWTRVTEALPRLKYDLEGIASWLPRASALLQEMSSADVSRLESEHRKLEDDTASLVAALDEKQAAYDQAAAKVFSPETLRVESLQSEIARFQFDLDRKRRKVIAERTELERVESRMAELPSELDSVERELNMAHKHAVASSAWRLREGLTPGDDCPVCDQHISEELPPLNQPDDAGVPVRPVEVLAATKGRLEGEAQMLDEKSRSLTASVEEGERVTDETDGHISRHSEEVAQLLGEGVTVKMLRDRMIKAEGSRSRAQKEYQSHLNATGAVRERYEKALGLKDRAAALLSGSTFGTPQEAAEALGTAVMQRSSEQKQLRQKIAAMESDLQKLRDECGGNNPLQADASLQTEIETLLGAEKWLRSEAEAVADLESDLESERLDYEMYQVLYNDLADHRLVRWMLDEERERLAQLGDKHLKQLSNERYGIVVDGDDLAILDGDHIRNASTLSGGETFLASLALALGLGEMIGQSTHPVGCFFLDEGFGSLDPNHIDQAMSGVESMAAGNQLVVVVSHLESVKSRLEHCIEMIRTPSGVTGQAAA